MIAEPAPGSHSEADQVVAGGVPGKEDAPDALMRFAAGIAHDFNNLLTVVNGYSEMILRDEPDAESCRLYVRNILEAGSKAAGVVELILAYAGSPALSTEIFDVNHEVAEAREFLDRYLGKAISLDLRTCAGPAPVKGDRNRFQLALVNLTLNAKEAMPGGGRLEVVTRRIPFGESGGFALDPRSPRLELSMRDTGCGMSKEELACVFQPYFSTKRKSNVHGIGLGLACVQGIVRQLGGGILAESEPGKGSVFRMCLPMADEAL